MGKSYKHLSLEERALLQTQLEMGWSPAAIAAGLAGDLPAFTREMARNGWMPEPAVRGRGRPAKAGGYRAARPRSAPPNWPPIRAWSARCRPARLSSTMSSRICAGA